MNNSLLWFQPLLLNVKIQLSSKDMTNSICGNLDSCMGNKGVIFCNVFTIFAYKNFNINVESTTITRKMQTMDTITELLMIFWKFGRD